MERLRDRQAREHLPLCKYKMVDGADLRVEQAGFGLKIHPTVLFKERLQKHQRPQVPNR